jgi:hypothetical protein
LSILAGRNGSTAAHRIGQNAAKPSWEESVERIGQCHCGSLRVIATGEPDRVYLCHCKACQRRTGTAFHFGASFPKEQVRLDGERKVYERDTDSGYRIRFHFCPNCGTTLYWEGDRNPAVCGVAVGAFDTSAFSLPSDSIWEESMHPWLGLPEGIDHHEQARPPITIERNGPLARCCASIAKWSVTNTRLTTAIISVQIPVYQPFADCL